MDNDIDLNTCIFCNENFNMQDNILFMSPCGHPTHQMCYVKNCVNTANLSCASACVASRAPRGAMNFDGSQFVYMSTDGDAASDFVQHPIDMVEIGSCSICTMTVYSKSHYIAFFCKKHVAHVLCCEKNTDVCTVCNTVASCIEAENRATTPNDEDPFVEKIVKGPVPSRAFCDMRITLSDHMILVQPEPTPTTFLGKSFAAVRTILGEDDKTIENTDVQRSFSHDVRNTKLKGPQLSGEGYSRLDFMGSDITWDMWLKSGRTLADLICLNLNVDNLHAIGYFTHRPATDFMCLKAHPFNFKFVDFLYHFSANNFLNHVRDFSNVFRDMGFTSEVADAMCIPGSEWIAVSRITHLSELTASCLFPLRYFETRGFTPHFLRSAGYEQRITNGDKFITTPTIAKPIVKAKPLQSETRRSSKSVPEKYEKTRRLIHGKDRRKHSRKRSSNRDSD